MAVVWKKLLMEGTRHTVAEMPAMTDEKIWKGTGGNVEEVDVPSAGEGHIFLLPTNYNSTPQGTWALAVNAGYFLGVFHNGGSKTDGDNFTFECYMVAGTYTLRMMVVKDPGAPISDIDIEGSEVASFDWYNAAEVKNAVQSQTNIPVAAAGLKTITVRIDGRNGSATDWQLSVLYLAFWRTA